MIKLTQLLDDYGLPELADRMDRLAAARNDLPELADRLDREILIKQCQHCNAIHENGAWRPHLEKITRGNVSHGICPKCEHILKNELNEMMKTAMRPFQPDDIYDPRPLKGLKTKPVTSIGWTEDRYPILVVPQDIVTMQTGDPNSRGTVALPPDKIQPVSSMARELWKTLGLYPQESIIVSDKGSVPWYIRHEKHHIDELGLPKRENPIIDTNSKNQNEKEILERIQYLLRANEIYAYTGMVVDFLNAKGFKPPKNFMPEKEDAFRLCEWFRKYIDVPQQIAYSVAKALLESKNPILETKKLLQNRIAMRSLADRVQEELLISCLKQFPWIKKYLKMPDGSPAGRT